MTQVERLHDFLELHPVRGVGPMEVQCSKDALERELGIRGGRRLRGAERDAFHFGMGAARSRPCKVVPSLVECRIECDGVVIEPR